MVGSGVQQSVPVATPTAVANSPQITSDQFRRISDRVRATTGIVLKEHKSIMVQSRISRRLHALGFASFDDYMDFMDGPDGDTELQNFCNAITTNLTSFFRESHHFDHLEQELGQFASPTAPKLRIWSAGCSTGEEPYCISLILAKLLPNLEDKKILATDLDTAVLEHGKAGTYPAQKLEHIDQNFHRFIVRNPADGTFSFSQPIRDTIVFNSLNLLHKWPFEGPFDFVFCRNVLIYFDAKTKADLISRYARILKPNGVLYLGHSETILEDHPLLTVEGRTTYRKKV